MVIRSIVIRASGFFAFLAVMFALSPQPAAAFHVQAIVVLPTSIDSITRTVTVNIGETTVGSGTIHSQAIVQWGDAVTSNKPWTSTFGTSPKFYSVAGVSHIYPDLTDRTIKVTSDCCGGFSPLTDTVAVRLGCADTPMGACNATAGKAQLQIKNNAVDSKDKLKFKWLKGTEPAFASPLGSTEYYLCIYAPGLVLQAIVPNITNWSATGTTGFKYDEATGAAGGLTKIKLKQGTGKAKILVKGQGVNLDDPLPLTQPVLVQLQNSTGQCWEHQFASPEIHNSAEQFKDKEP